MTLKEAIALFLAQYKKKSQETYGYNLKAYANFTGQDRPIESITPLHILEYQQFVEGRDIALATRMTYFKMVKIFFNWLVKIDFLDKSPARALKIRRVNSPVDKEKAMTDEELSKILDWVKWRTRDLALILFLADTGCRAGGAAGLRLQDIDLVNRVAMVTEKGDKTRPVSFQAVCGWALAAWIEKRSRLPGVYVFSETETPLQSASVSQVVTRACVKAGVRPLGSHSLRHRKGHQLAFAGIPVSLIARFLGHERVSTTMEAYQPTNWSHIEGVSRAFGVKEEDVPGLPVATPEEKKVFENPRLRVLKKGG